MLISKTLFRQLVFFGVVGVITLLIDVSVTSLLYNQLNTTAFLASAVGFLSGFCFNFPMNRKRVFRHDTNDRFTLKAQVLMFISLSVFNLVFTSALTSFLVTTLELRIGYAKLGVTVVIAIWNFIIFKTLIFGKLKPTTNQELDDRTLNSVL